ncbi:MAG: UDP-N-acetylmuramoyl-L-alanine--D-glutamate ligase [Planctomycetota bacterium]
MPHTLHDDDISGARITVMGLGRFGGGAGATRWLRARGADVTVTDLRTEQELGPALDTLGREGLTLRLGGHDPRDFEHCDALVVNPAIPKPWEHPHVRRVEERGGVVTTEIRLACERIPEGVLTIGVTGSTGKSTTASMLHAALGSAWSIGRARLAGNIGGSLLDTIDELERFDVLTLELSSAQLWWLSREPVWTPDLALVTNLVPNHLDWHGDLDHYEQSKRAIVGERLCCHPGAIEEWGGGAEVRTASGLASPERVTLPGAHNAQNAALALAGAEWALGLRRLLDDASRAKADDAVRAFAGLEHRLSTLGVAGGVRIVDDSKCSTPEGAALAVDAFDAGRVHLICGGADKGVDLAPMVDAAAQCKSVLCIGSTGPAIFDALGERAERAIVCGTLERAMDQLAFRVEAGDVALLSPGCASWDQFANYTERARVFRAEAERVLGPLVG